MQPLCTVHSLPCASESSQTCPPGTRPVTACWAHPSRVGKLEAPSRGRNARPPSRVPDFPHWVPVASYVRTRGKGQRGPVIMAQSCLFPWTGPGVGKALRPPPVPGTVGLAWLQQPHHGSLASSPAHGTPPMGPHLLPTPPHEPWHTPGSLLLREEDVKTAAGVADCFVIEGTCSRALRAPRKGQMGSDGVGWGRRGS